MTQFLQGKLAIEKNADNLLFETETQNAVSHNKPLQFSAEATAVFDAGRALWTNYHAQPAFASHQSNYNVNASFYDIRAHFQGRNDKGRMNARSEDPTYTALIATLRNNLSILADKIEPKIYEYEFLKE